MLLGFLDKVVGRYPAALLFGLLTAGPSRRRSSYRGLGPSELKPLKASHRRCDVKKRQGCFGKKKNDRLICKKPPNPVGTEEENQDRKNLVVVQSFRINLCGQWCEEL